MADNALANALNLNFSPLDTGYGIGAQTIGQATPALINPYGNVGTNFGIVLGSALLQGLLGYQARQEATSQSLLANRLGMQMLAAPTAQERLTIAEQAGDTGVQRRLLDLNQTLLAQQAARDQLIGAEVAKEEALAKFKLGELGTKLYERDLASRELTQGNQLEKLLLQDRLIRERDLERRNLSRENVDVPVALTTQAAQQNATANRAIDLAEAVDAYASTPEFLASKSFSGFGNDALKSDFQNLASLVTLSRTGKSSTETERATLASITAGDWTAVNPKVVSNILRKFAKDERTFAAEMIQGATQRPETLVQEMLSAAEQGRKTQFQTRVPNYGMAGALPTPQPQTTNETAEQKNARLKEQLKRLEARLGIQK